MRSAAKPCSRADARLRIKEAEEYFHIAKVYTANDPEPSRSVGASNAVLAGIAAADAACCWALGQRNAGAHDDAPAILRRVAGGRPAATALKRLLDLKTQVQYVGRCSAADLNGAQRQAAIVLSFATEVVS